MKKKIASFMVVVVIVLVAATSVFASEDAFFEEVIEEETAVDAAVAEEEAVDSYESTGIGYFQDSFGEYSLKAEDGKTIFTVGGDKTNELSARLSAYLGFIDQVSMPGTVYVQFQESLSNPYGYVYFYSYKYQGITGKLINLGYKARRLVKNSNGDIIAFITEDGVIHYLLTEREIKEKLGIEDEKKEDTSSSEKKEDTSSSEKKEDTSSSEKKEDTSSNATETSVSKNGFLRVVITDNTLGYKTYTLVDENDNVVKIGQSTIDCKFDFITANKILFNGKKFMPITTATFNEFGELVYHKGRHVYVLTMVRTKSGSIKFKKIRIAKKAALLHVDPKTGLADYIELYDGRIVAPYSRYAVVVKPN